MHVFTLQCKLASCNNTKSPLSIGGRKQRLGPFLWSLDLCAWLPEREGEEKAAWEGREAWREGEDWRQVASSCQRPNCSPHYGASSGRHTGEEVRLFFLGLRSIHSPPSVSLYVTFLFSFYSFCILADVSPPLLNFQPCLLCSSRSSRGGKTTGGNCASDLTLDLLSSRCISFPWGCYLLLVRQWWS